MKKRLSLPFEMPDFICQSNYMAGNAIVRSNAKGDKLMALMAPRCLNCRFDEESKNQKFVVATYDQWYRNEGFIQFQMVKFLKDTFIEMNTDIILIIKKLISDGCYVYSACERSCVEPEAEKGAPVLYFLITGYDDVAHELTMYGLNYKFDEFKCFKVGYSDFIDALFATSSNMIKLDAWICDTEREIVLDTKHLTRELSDYINSECTRKEYTADKIYGFAAIEMLAKYFLESAKNGEELYKPYLDKLVFHKKLMRDRIEYLSRLGMVDASHVAEADAVLAVAEDIKEYARLFASEHNLAYVEKLCDSIYATIEMEKEYLPKVLGEVK